jgi:hypothetical protein
MFVETFASGRAEVNPGVGTPTADGTPVPGGGAPLLLTLEGHTGQTIYFSDRPDRIVGAVPTETFLGQLGFSAANPPNAALVAEFEAGQGVVVLELIEPSYDAESGTLTYGAAILEGYRGGNLAPVTAAQVTERLPAVFGASALFIDTYGDICPDVTGCYRSAYGGGQQEYMGLIAGGPYAMCYSWSDGNCLPCTSTWSDLDELCNGAYPECSENCVAW